MPCSPPRERRETSGPGRLIIVSGLPATGKTTLAQQLEHDLGAVRFPPDEWMADLKIDLFDGSTREQIEQLQWRLAQRLLELGTIVIIEWGTWDAPSATLSATVRARSAQPWNSGSSTHHCASCGPAFKTVTWSATRPQTSHPR